MATLGLLLVSSCNENNTEVNNTTNPNSSETNAETSQDNASNETTSASENQDKKSDEELILEGSKFLINTAMDIAEKQRIKDSINRANREKMYAYKIGLQYKEKDAFQAYQTLLDAGISNVYVFKAGRKEYYLVRFEAKGEEELNVGYGDFKTQLGDNGTEGLKVINLMDFCDKKETIIKQTETSKGNEIKCLVCD